MSFRGLQVSMEKVGDLQTQLVYITQRVFLVDVFFVEQTINDRAPDMDGIHISQIAATFCRHHGQAPCVVAILIDHRLPWRSRLAIHAVPHIELMDRLLQRHLQSNFRFWKQREAPIRCAEQGAVDIPQHDANSRQRRDRRLRFEWLRRRDLRPDQISLVQRIGVFGKSQRHSKTSSEAAIRLQKAVTDRVNSTFHQEHC